MTGENEKEKEVSISLEINRNKYVVAFSSQQQTVLRMLALSGCP